MRRYRITLLFAFCAWVGLASSAAWAVSPASVEKTVPVLPIRDDITTSMVFLVRRGVKSAIEANAQLLVIDMDTNGGLLDKTQEIIEILGKFPGTTVTYVNRKAFSAGAFISFATQKIYMAPEAVIGAAAPVLAGAGGGVQQAPDTMEAKMTSATAALVRASAEKNGHNVEVADAMVRKTKELTVDGETLNKPGELLTLTSKAAERRYGSPPKPLLSLGTFATLDELLASLGFAEAKRVMIQPTGLEKLGSWLSSQWMLSILLIIGIAGVYIEFKTPGFGVPGIVGISAFALYFLGGYIAGLSGAEWVLVFLVGVALVLVEILVFPGVLVVGLSGLLLVFVALIMALVDVYPHPGSWLPPLPTGTSLILPMRTLVMAAMGATLILLVLSRVLPHTSLYQNMVSRAASGSQSEIAQQELRESLLGKEGVAISSLRPGGKAKFGNSVIDVLTQGELVTKGTRVRIIAFSATEAVVERIS